MAKKGSAVVGTELLNLDPAVILADDNTRYNLKQSRIETLAQSILDRGRVLEPIEVEPSDKNDGGFQYRLTTGFYRLAAVMYLNTTQGAGLTIPATVQTNATSTDRLKTQIAENMERENQSPMDQAIAIKRLLDAGLSKMEVRTIFSRPGGRKGNKTQPASNSFINMTLSFLDLSKSIQEKIHLGIIGVAAAYELTKVPVDRRTEVLERAEAQRQKDLEREERDEEKLLASEKKLAEDKEKRDKTLSEVQKAEAEAVTAHATFKAKGEVAAAAYNAAKVKHPDAATKKLAEKAFKTAEEERKAAEGEADVAQKAYETLKMKFEKTESAAAEKAAKLKAARAATPQGAAKGKGEAVSGGDVKKAAAAAGASTSYVPLNAAEMRKLITALTLPGGNPKVMDVARVIVRGFAGELTESEVHSQIAKIVG